MFVSRVNGLAVDGRRVSQSVALLSGGSGVPVGLKSAISGSVSGSSASSSAYGVARLVEQDRERLAPVALPAEEPVAQLVVDRSDRPVPSSSRIVDDLLLGLRGRQAVDERRVDRDAFAGERADPLRTSARR